MAPFTPADLIAAAWFVASWGLFSMVIDHSRLSARTLNGRMDAYRTLWMHRMVEREVRILDSTVMGSLQNGTAFFASTALIALGGSLSLLRASDDAMAIFGSLPLAIETTRSAWETKVAGLCIVFGYAFFKFAWSYRLMNFAAILVAATPNVFSTQSPEAMGVASHAAAMNRAAGAQFNRGQRAFFLALGYLGWFVSPYVFLATTTVVIGIMARRQFASSAVSALKDPR